MGGTAAPCRSLWGWGVLDVFDALRPHFGAILVAFAGTVMSGVVAVFGFFVRYYFNRLHADLDELKGAVRHLEGRFDSLQGDVRLNTAAVAGMKELTEKEFAAVWRAIDPPPRVSDIRKG